MASTAEGLLTRFKALIPEPHLDEAGENSNRGGEFMEGRAKQLLDAFTQVEETVGSTNKRELLTPVKDAALDAFDATRMRLLRKWMRVTDEAVNEVIADELFFQGRKTGEMRRRLEAEMDVLLAKGEADSVRDRRVQRRAFVTAVAGILISVSLSTAISLSTQRSTQRDERRYRQREALRQTLLPRLDRLVEAVPTVWYTPHPEADSVVLPPDFEKRLSEAIGSLDSLGESTCEELRVAFSEPIGTEYCRVEAHAKSLLQDVQLNHNKFGGDNWYHPQFRAIRDSLYGPFDSNGRPSPHGPRAAGMVNSITRRLRALLINFDR